MSPLQGGLFSPVLPTVAGGPGGHCAIRRRQIIIGPFVVIKQEHSTCVLNELMEKCKLNLGVNWENIKSRYKPGPSFYYCSYSMAF